MSVTDRKPGETDKVYYYRIAKAADKRIEALEKLSEQEGFKKVKNWSYAKAQQNIKRWSGESGKPRFNKKAPDTNAELRSKIKDIKEFLESPSSSKRTIVKFYKKRAEAISEKLEINVTWEDLANWFENKQFDENFHHYGSGDTFRVYSALKKGVKENEADELEKALKNGKLKTAGKILQVDDEIMLDKLAEMVKDNNLDIKDFVTK